MATDPLHTTFHFTGTFPVRVRYGWEQRATAAAGARPPDIPVTFTYREWNNGTCLLTVTGHGISLTMHSHLSQRPGNRLAALAGPFHDWIVMRCLWLNDDGSLPINRCADLAVDVCSGHDPDFVRLDA